MRRMKWRREHLPDPLPAEPLELAASWLAEATRKEVQPNPNAMVLATADAAGQPSARVVLCKQIAPQPGFLTFYTNYQSRKGRDAEEQADDTAQANIFARIERTTRALGPFLIPMIDYLGSIGEGDVLQVAQRGDDE